MNSLHRTPLKAAVVLGMATVIMLSGCAGGGGSGSTGADGDYVVPDSDIEATLTVATAGGPEDAALYDAATARFNERFPNVTVENNFTNSASWTDYINKLLSQIAAGDSPDVITMATEGIEFGYSKDLFLPLDNYIDQDQEAQDLLADIADPLVESFQKDGETYLLPNNWNAMVMFYNTRMFEEAGIERPRDDWTIDEFLEIAQQLTTGSGDNKVFGFGIPSFSWALQPWLYSHGASWASEDLTEPTLDSPEMVEAMQFLQDLVLKYQVSPQTAGSDPYQLFPAEKVAMTAGGSFMMVPLQDAGMDDYDVLPWPKDVSQTSVFGTSGVSIYKDAQNKDLAWEYLKELAGQESQMDYAVARTNNPTTRTAATSPEFLGTIPQHASLFYDTIEMAKSIDAPTFYPTLEPAFQRALEEIMGGADPYTALHKANEEVKASISND